MSAEDRLRHTLRDGDWSLPIWAAPNTQLRAAKRRRRSVLVAIAVVVSAVTAGVVVPLSLAGGSTTHRPRIAHRTHRPPRLPRLPSPTDLMFPESIYPAPGRALQHTRISCPSLAGVDRTAPPLRTSAYRKLGADFGRQSFINDLRRSDRSLWQVLQHEYANLVDVTGPTAIGHWSPVRVQSLRLSAAGPSAAVDCGDALVNRSVELTYHNGPVGQNSVYVLKRNGHLLLWGPTPFVADTGADPYEGETATYARHHPAPCGGVFQTFSVQRHGRAATVIFTAHLPQDYFRCSLRGWLTITLNTADEPLVNAHHVGTAHPVILTPGQTATVTLRTLRCPGRTTTYSFANLGVDPQEAIRDTVSIPVGRCGVDEGPYVKQ